MRTPSGRHWSGLVGSGLVLVLVTAACSSSPTGNGTTGPTAGSGATGVTDA